MKSRVRIILFGFVIATLLVLLGVVAIARYSSKPEPLAVLKFEPFNGSPRVWCEFAVPDDIRRLPFTQPAGAVIQKEAMAFTNGKWRIVSHDVVRLALELRAVSSLGGAARMETPVAISTNFPWKIRIRYIDHSRFRAGPFRFRAPFTASRVFESEIFTNAPKETEFRKN